MELYFHRIPMCFQHDVCPAANFSSMAWRRRALVDSSLRDKVRGRGLLSRAPPTTAVALFKRYRTNLVSFPGRIVSGKWGRGMWPNSHPPGRMVPSSRLCCSSGCCVRGRGGAREAPRHCGCAAASVREPGARWV